MLLNNYFVCLVGQDDPIAFNPFAYRESDFPGFIEINYLAGSLRELERQKAIKDRTIYITWDTKKLPSYGEKIIAILMGDEWCHLPRYATKIHIIFRQYGVRPEISRNSLTQLSQLNALLVLQFLRATLHGLPNRLRHAFKQFSKGRLQDPKYAPQYVIPLGFANQLDLPLLEFEARPLDLYFAGSLGNQKPGIFSLKYWIQSPKNVARHRAVASAKELAKKRPNLSVQIETTTVHVPSELKGSPDYQDEAKRYSEKLMSCKICLVPRGSSPDTPRFFEALRFGCVPMGDSLPDRWFYKNAPFLEVKDWDCLGELVATILNNPSHVDRLHKAALEYWHSVCSEEALGKFLAEKLTIAESSIEDARSAASCGSQHFQPGE